MRFVHLTLHSRSRLRSRTHILANVIETNKRSLPNSRLSFFIVLVLSARLAILTEVHALLARLLTVTMCHFFFKTKGNKKPIRTGIIISAST